MIMARKTDEDRAFLMSKEELEEWLNDQDISKEEFLASGGLLSDVTEDDLKDMIGELLERELGGEMMFKKDPESVDMKTTVHYVDREVFDSFKDWTEADQKAYLDQKEKGFS